ncbi:MAG: GtrA family protein [Candidatus Delongbacteria bacterium]|nr:GtrA family protein [Candidatus Delongbacteria bacterium]
MIEALLRQKTDNIFIQLIRYTFVGGFAFFFDFSALFILTEYCEMHYLFSAVFAFLIGLLINYKISILWVFKNRNLKSKHNELLVFAFIGLVGLILNEFFIWFFTEKLNNYYMISKSISAILVYLWNFFVRKFTLFR